jgi:hypothetical protein
MVFGWIDLVRILSILLIFGASVLRLLARDALFFFLFSLQRTQRSVLVSPTCHLDIGWVVLCDALITLLDVGEKQVARLRRRA